MPPRSSALNRGDLAVQIRGLAELQRALKRADGNAGKYLRADLKGIADDVKADAQANVTHRTGRHGGANVPHLAPSIRTSVTTKGASVYSDAPHAIVQDVGGRVGHGAILQRAKVSHYMTQAVQDAEPYINKRLTGLLDDLGHDFEQ